MARRRAPSFGTKLHAAYGRIGKNNRDSRGLNPERFGMTASVQTSESGAIDPVAIAGRKYILARFCQTAGGAFLEPLHSIEIDIAGRVVGMGEYAIWIRHFNGFAICPKAGIPTIIFNRVVNGMPVGFFNLEGHISHHVTLIPDVPTNWGKRIYLIASCAGFFERTTPGLIRQLLDDGARADQIKVVINGSDRKHDAFIAGVHHAFTRHNAWEFSALYEAPLRFSFDHAWMMHDTTLIDPGFHERAWDIRGGLKFEHCPATVHGRCCLGIFSRKYLSRLSGTLRALDGISKAAAISFECAAELIQRAKLASTFQGARLDEWIEEADQWGTGTRRFRRHFMPVGLHKFTSVNPIYAKSL